MFSKAIRLLGKAADTYRSRGLAKLIDRVSRFFHLRGQVYITVILRWNFLRITRNGVADPYKVIWIDPSSIEQVHGRFDRTDVGKILDGNWDEKKLEKLTASKKYELVRLHIEDDLSWREIIEEHILPILERKGSFDGKSSISEIESRYSRIEKLCEDIRKNGIKSYEELGESRTALNHIAVDIGRDGEFIFEGSGFHRLSVAKLLGLEEIPVQIWVRHEKWQQVRERVAKTGEVPEQYAGHPDLEDLQS